MLACASERTRASRRGTLLLSAAREEVSWRHALNSLRGFVGAEIGFFGAQGRSAE
jgi:hypothetical protein